MAVLTSFLQVFGVLGIYIFDVHYFVMTQVFFQHFSSSMGSPLKTILLCSWCLSSPRFRIFFTTKWVSIVVIPPPLFSFSARLDFPPSELYIPSAIKYSFALPQKMSFNFDPKKYTLKLAVFSLKSTETLILSYESMKNKP